MNLWKEALNNQDEEGDDIRRELREHYTILKPFGQRALVKAYLYLKLKYKKRVRTKTGKDINITELLKCKKVPNISTKSFSIALIEALATTRFFPFFFFFLGFTSASAFRTLSDSFNIFSHRRFIEVIVFFCRIALPWPALILPSLILLLISKGSFSNLNALDIVVRFLPIDFAISSWDKSYLLFSTAYASSSFIAFKFSLWIFSINAIFR